MKVVYKYSPTKKILAVNKWKLLMGIRLQHLVEQNCNFTMFFNLPYVQESVPIVPSIILDAQKHQKLC